MRAPHGAAPPDWRYGRGCASSCGFSASCSASARSSSWSARGRWRLLLLEIFPGPAGLRPARELRAAGDDPRPRGRRQPDRRICPRAPALPADPGRAEARHRRLPVGRGQEFLQAPRHRSGRHRPRRRSRTSARGGRREQGASTITQQVAKNFLSDHRADARAQDPGGADRAAHRGDLLEGQDPRALPERDLSRACAGATTASPRRR